VGRVGKYFLWVGHIYSRGVHWTGLKENVRADRQDGIGGQDEYPPIPPWPLGDSISIPRSWRNARIYGRHSCHSGNEDDFSRSRLPTDK
jgi:hypothetical protein